MTRRAPIAFFLLFALAATTSGSGMVCPGLDPSADAADSADSAGLAAATRGRAEDPLPPCHRQAPAAKQRSDADADAKAGGSTKSARPTPPPSHPGSEGEGCCDPASGMTCPHACHCLAVPRDEATLSLRAVLAPLGERPAGAAPAPLPRGVDHIPLA